MRIINIIFLVAITLATVHAKRRTIDRQFMDSSFNHAIELGFFPGAQLIVGDSKGVIYEKNYGWSDYSKSHRVDSKSVYDLASCSKVLGTTLSVMRLVEQGKIRLDSKLSDIVPQYSNSPIAELTLLDMLTHTTGLVPFVPFYRQLVVATDGKELISKDSSEVYNKLFGDVYVNRNNRYVDQYISRTAKDGYQMICDSLYLNPKFYGVMAEQIKQSRTRPSGKYLYSDLNLILAQAMIEKAGGATLDKLAAGLYHQMRLSNIGYRPLEWSSMNDIMPTEEDNIFRMRLVHGYAHDEVAAILGNVAGHAGLFANARSVSAICQMILRQGGYHGKQIIDGSTIKEFTASPLADKGVYRGIGFDKRNPNDGNIYSADSFGHTGFTGTFFWVDPARDVYVVILTNRVYPTRSNNLMYSDKFRDKIWSNLLKNK